MTQPLTERDMQTELGQTLGTMEYMSPEQADLLERDVDTRTDVYSLAACFSNCWWAPCLSPRWS